MSRRALRTAVVGGALALSATAATLVAPMAYESGPEWHGMSHASPPPRGYFQQRGVGAWSSLPAGNECARRVHRSTWEPRPANKRPNHTVVDQDAVDRSLRRRPRSTQGAYDRRWDTWLLPRVGSWFTGTTDEIFQWSACKWGLSDNLLRAIAVRESTWFQYPTYPDRRCVTNWGCGDMVTSTNDATRRYCAGLARHGYDYRTDYGEGRCPKTFSIVGVMSWHDPAWGTMPGNQNGTFPFNRDATAFAVDYLGAHLRGCLEGWETWLDNTGTRSYRAGHLWGCVGAWYSGAWHDEIADGYIERVRDELRRRRWLRPGWSQVSPACTARYGCPAGRSF